MFKKKLIIPVILILSNILFFSTALAEPDIKYSKGQTVYVPIYSHVYFGDKEQQFLLTATLSIRNTDSKNNIVILAVNYYDSSGKFINNYLDSPVNLNALASSRYVVKESDKIGGSGAKFIVKWKSDHQVSPPIIEAIMIGTRSQQGISFTSRGQVTKGEAD